MCCFYQAKTVRLDNSRVPVEPEIIDVDKIRQEYVGQVCVVCNGFGRLKCNKCQDGRVSFLGGLQECSHCKGVGLKICPCCQKTNQ